VIVASSFLRNFHRIQCGKVFVGEFGHVQRSPIEAPQALIFLSRQQHDVVTAVTGHYDCFAMGDAA
jgi:hypothetical protein